MDRACLQLFTVTWVPKSKTIGMQRSTLVDLFD